jgi:hypothetical protein
MGRHELQLAQTGSRENGRSGTLSLRLGSLLRAEPLAFWQVEEVRERPRFGRYVTVGL